MRKHTTIDLDLHLVNEAKEALGTRKTSETVHAALREAVRASQRRRLLELDTDLTLDDLERARAWRTAAE
jgi:Arc/MetJ family transcription regulator